MAYTSRLSSRHNALKTTECRDKLLKYVADKCHPWGISPEVVPIATAYLLLMLGHERGDQFSYDVKLPRNDDWLTLELFATSGKSDNVTSAWVANMPTAFLGQPIIGTDKHKRPKLSYHINARELYPVGESDAERVLRRKTEHMLDGLFSEHILSNQFVLEQFQRQSGRRMYLTKEVLFHLQLARSRFMTVELKETEQESIDHALACLTYLLKNPNLDGFEPEDRVRVCDEYKNIGGWLERRLDLVSQAWNASPTDLDRFRGQSHLDKIREAIVQSTGIDWNMEMLAVLDIIKSIYVGDYKEVTSSMRRVSDAIGYYVAVLGQGRSDLIAGADANFQQQYGSFKRPAVSDQEKESIWKNLDAILDAVTLEARTTKRDTPPLHLQQPVNDDTSHVDRYISALFQPTANTHAL